MVSEILVVVVAVEIGLGLVADLWETIVLDVVLMKSVVGLCEVGFLNIVVRVWLEGLSGVMVFSVLLVCVGLSNVYLGDGAGFLGW